MTQPLRPAAPRGSRFPAATPEPRPLARVVPARRRVGRLAAGLLLSGVLLGAAGGAQATTAGVALASGISAEQAAAIRQQVAATGGSRHVASPQSGGDGQASRPAPPLHPGQRASGRAEPCPGGNLAPADERDAACATPGDAAAQGRRERGEATMPRMRLADSGWEAFIAARVADRPGVDLAADNHWRGYPQTGQRSPVYRSLNRPGLDLSERRIDDWVRQLGLLGVDPGAARRLITERTFRGESVAGFFWRPEVGFDATRGPLLDRDALGDRRASRAALGELFRHSHRLESDGTRAIHANWPGVTRGGWHQLRFGPDPQRLQPDPPASMTPSPSPWDDELGP